MKKIFATTLLAAASEAVSIRSTTRSDTQAVLAIEEEGLPHSNTFYGGRFTLPQDNDFQSLAQASQYDFQCHDVFARLQNMPDVDSLMAAGTTFTDDSFDQEQAMYQRYDTYEWTRMSEKYPHANGYSLFAHQPMDSIDINDTFQGYLGDCWVLASFAAMAEHPQRVWDMFQIKTYNEAGVYSLKMYELGIPISVVIDDYLPTLTWGDSGLYTDVSADRETWPMLVEKAFAKLHGGYNAIEGGYQVHAGMAMMGTAGSHINHYQITADQLWDYIVYWDDQHHIMTAGVDSGQMGLIGWHAYTFIHHYTLSTGERIVKLRNPWGMSEWSGAFHDGDEYWVANPQEAEAVGYTNHDDGVFFMTIEDYHMYVGSTAYNYDPQGWHHAYWAAIGDADTIGEAGSSDWCGPERCKRTKFDITSEVEQFLHISVHLHQRRQYIGDECRKATTDSVTYHYTAIEGRCGYAWIWDIGYINQPPIYVAAGETLTVIMEIDWMRPNIEKDFSITAWGESGPVTITEQGTFKESAHYYNWDPNSTTTDETHHDDTTTDDIWHDDFSITDDFVTTDDSTTEQWPTPSMDCGLWITYQADGSWVLELNNQCWSASESAGFDVTMPTASWANEIEFYSQSTNHACMTIQDDQRCTYEVEMGQTAFIRFGSAWDGWFTHNQWL